MQSKPSAWLRWRRVVTARNGPICPLVRFAATATASTPAAERRLWWRSTCNGSTSSSGAPPHGSSIRAPRLLSSVMSATVPPDLREVRLVNL